MDFLSLVVVVVSCALLEVVAAAASVVDSFSFVVMVVAFSLLFVASSLSSSVVLASFLSVDLESSFLDEDVSISSSVGSSAVVLLSSDLAIFKGEMKERETKTEVLACQFTNTNLGRRGMNTEMKPDNGSTREACDKVSINQNVGK